MDRKRHVNCCLGGSPECCYEQDALADYRNEALDQVMRWNRGDDVALQIIENQMRKIKIGKGREFSLPQ